ncbi:CD276 antigen-like isoform 1-T4 [Vipera latastei]
MASFLKLPFTFLLLSVLSDSQAGAGNLSCSKHNIAELGKLIKIECKNNEPIIKMGVEFYSNFSTKQNANLTDVKTEKNNSMAFLVIKQVKISHEGNYDLTYVAEDGMGVLTISLEVFAPYTSPQVMKQKDTLICTASGGYPEEKLYWISKAETKLTHKSTSESVKNEDGSFNLSNILQLESPPSETEYCCTFNKTRVPNRQPAPTCMTLTNVTNSTITGEETTLKTTKIIGIPIIFISLVFCLWAVFCYRRRKKNGSSARRISIAVGSKDLLIQLNKRHSFQSLDEI